MPTNWTVDSDGKGDALKEKIWLKSTMCSTYFIQVASAIENSYNNRLF